jgi:uncharacterized protein (TIGR00255 family)
MVCSMTAFARQAGQGEWSHTSWEIRSVNHRYLEISIRLPEELREIEVDVRECVSGSVHRGKIDCVLRYVPPTHREKLSINRLLVQQLTRLCGEIDTSLPNPAPLSSIQLLSWPGVIQLEPLPLDWLRRPLLAILEAALSVLVKVRAREGQTLRSLIEERCEQAGLQIAQIREKLPMILTALKERLLSRALELTDRLDPSRLEQEMLLLAQKLDVAEELERLETHLAELRRILAQKGPIGRRLDFLIQEMNREANTVASKSIHVETTRASVELKVLIEQMREQAQNIE